MSGLKTYVQQGGTRLSSEPRHDPDLVEVSGVSGFLGLVSWGFRAELSTLEASLGKKS